MEFPATTLAKAERARRLKSPVPVNSGHLSFAERKAHQMARASATPLVEGGPNMRDILRPLPGDGAFKPRRAQSKPELTNQRSLYFEDAFSTRGAGNAAKERMRGEAMVVAEIKTNVIISDEFTVVTELSSHLAARYRRPLSSIAVVLEHGKCMFFGGTFDPAYIMSVFALGVELQPATNKRNAALIQKHMEEAIGVPPARGFLAFVPATEENLAQNGKTVAGELEDLAKDAFASGEALGVTPRRCRSGKRMGAKSFGALRDLPKNELTPPASAGEEEPPPVPPLPQLSHESNSSIPATQEKKARRSKSFIAMLFRKSSTKGGNLSPVPSELDIRIKEEEG